MKQLIIIFFDVLNFAFSNYFYDKSIEPKKVLTVFCMKVMEYVDELFFAYFH